MDRKRRTSKMGNKAKSKQTGEEGQTLEQRIVGLEQQMTQVFQMLTTLSRTLMQRDEHKQKTFFAKLLQLLSKSSPTSTSCTEEYINAAYERCLVEGIAYELWIEWCQKYMETHQE